MAETEIQMAERTKLDTVYVMDIQERAGGMSVLTDDGRCTFFYWGVARSHVELSLVKGGVFVEDTHHDNKGGKLETDGEEMVLTDSQKTTCHVKAFSDVHQALAWRVARRTELYGEPGPADIEEPSEENPWP